MSYNTHSRDLFPQKRQYIITRLQQDPTVTMTQIGREIAEHFGCSIGNIPLRREFLDAGGRLNSSGRRAKNKRKNPTKRASSKNRPTGTQVESKVPMKSIARPVHPQAPRYVVITDSYQMNDRITKTFDTKSSATHYIEEQINLGVSASSINFFERQPVQLSVKL